MLYFGSLYAFSRADIIFLSAAFNGGILASDGSRGDIYCIVNLKDYP